jgi:lysophospholipase L1-like esterase
MMSTRRTTLGGGARWAFLCLAVAGCTATRTSTGEALTLFDGQAHAGLQVRIASQDGEQQLKNGSAEVLSKAPAAQSQASVRITAGERGTDALAMHWQDTWFASLRLVADKPMDLRGYLPGGAIEFDLDVQDMARAGLTFAMGCGQDCGAKVPYVLPSRALQGKGWTHLSIALSCFARDGNEFNAVTQPFVMESGNAGRAALANVRIMRDGRPNVPCVDYRVRSVTPEPLGEAWALDRWMPRHEAKLEEVRKLRASGVQPQLVFIGDSITEGWENAGRQVWDEYYKPYQALDLGFGGDRTENVLWRLQHGEVDGLSPKVVVLMIGTNNTGHRQEDPATTAAGIGRLVEDLRQRMPGAKVLLLAVFPRDERPDALPRRINDRVNARIAALADGRHVFFLDIGKDLTGPDGSLSRTVMPDLLHPNETGYRIWARSMQPTLQKLMKS